MIPLKLDLKHVLQLRSGGSRVHRINARNSLRSPSNDPRDATCPEMKIKEEVLSHMEKNNANRRVNNVR